jgi:hypothetical protein
MSERSIREDNMRRAAELDGAALVARHGQRLALPCLVCGRELEAVSDKDPVQPHDAVTFRAYGQFGSTVFDPQDSSQLYVNVCDACLAAKGRAGAVWHACYEQRPAVAKFERRWNPSSDDEDPE